MYTILILAAIIPAIYLLTRVYRRDRLEKEPISLLLTLVFLGVASTALASFTEQLGDIVLSYFIPEGTLAYNIIMYFLIVALSEEGFKYLLLKTRTWRSVHFNCRFDGVVYAVAVSLGFALWENIGYVLSYGLGTALARALTAVPGHACFGVFMGTWYGLAKRYEAAGMPERSRQARFLAVLVPMILHGIYDFIAVMQETSLTLIFVVFVAALFAASLRTVRRQAASDAYFDLDPLAFEYPSREP